MEGVPGHRVWIQQQWAAPTATPHLLSGRRNHSGRRDDLDANSVATIGWLAICLLVGTLGAVLGGLLGHRSRSRRTGVDGEPAAGSS